MTDTTQYAAPSDVSSYGEFRYASWSPRFMAACSVICFAIVLHLGRFVLAAAQHGVPAGSSLTEVILVTAYCLALLGASVYMAAKAASRLRFSLSLGSDGFAVSGRKISWSNLVKAHFQVVNMFGRGQERLKVIYRDPATGKERTVSMDWVLTGWQEIKEIFERENRTQ
jgi:hypothetical protein